MNHSKKEKRKVRNRILAAAAVVLLAAAGTAVWKLSDQPVNSPSVSETGSASDAYAGIGDKNYVSYGGEKYVYNDHLSNYLFLGIDRDGAVEEYESFGPGGQSDAIYLISMDRVTGEIHCLAIPRDTMTSVTVVGVNGEKINTMTDHLSLQYSYGDGKHKSCQLAKDAVSNLLYGIPIQGYCSVNMEGMPLLAELIGGVELTIPDNTLSGVNPAFVKGAVVTIDETNAEQFLRYRDCAENQSAVDRMNRQKVFLQAFFNKMQAEASRDSSIVTKIYEGLQPYMVTNMGNDLFVKLMENAGKNSGLDVITIPGEGTEGEIYDEFHVDESALYAMILNLFYEKE